MSNNAARAIPFAKAGWHLFPAHWNVQEKRHYGYIRWGKNSSCDVKKIEEWGKLHPDAHFCVNLSASGLRVVDVDVKNEKKGIANLSALIEEHKVFPKTLESKTPSGGKHFFFIGECGFGANKLAGGIDIPVMTPLPGQIVKGKGEYALVKPGKPALLPVWIVNKAGRQLLEDKDRLEPMCEIDLKHNTEKAIELLIDAEPAVQGDGGNDRTFKLLAKVRDLGISQEKCAKLALKYWYPRCEPNDKPAFIVHLTENVYNYAKLRIGNKTPEALFGDEEDFTVSTEKKERFHRASDIKLDELKPRKWLLGYRYLPKYVTLTIAPGGTGKSLLVILEGLSIASGRQLTHDKVHEQGGVWCYNTEEPKDELENRIMAATILHRLTAYELRNFYYDSGYEAPLKLAKVDDKGRPVANKKAIDYIIKKIKDNNIKLFIVDPLIKCHSLKENDNDHMDALMSIFAKIAKEGDCAISLVHHTPKGKKQRGDDEAARGAKSLVDASRIAHTLYRINDKEAEQNKVPIEKAAWYVRLDNAKANLAPPGAETQWFEKVGVSVFRNSEQTTGAIQAINISPVASQNVDDYIITSVRNMMEKDDEVSVNVIARDICKEGLIDKKERTVYRMIEKMFKKPMRFGNLTYFTEKNTKGRKVMVCMDVKNVL